MLNIPFVSLMNSKQTKIISIINQKGGVGKTASSINIGTALTTLGNKVLLIDADPQCDLTTALGVFDDDRYSIKDFIELKKNVDIESLQVFQNLYLISGYFDLMELKLTKSLFEIPLKMLGDYFDYIIFDCQPQRVVQSKLTINECVLYYTDYLVVPLDVNYNSVKGTVDFMNSIERIQMQHNPNLRIGGVFFNNVNKQEKLFEEYSQYLSTLNDELLLKTYIRRDISIKKSQSVGLPLYYFSQHYPSKVNNALEDFTSLTKELLSHIENVGETAAD